MAIPNGILFDLDGTLINSLGDLAAATNRALTEHGFPTHPLPPFCQFVGDGARMLVARALPAEAREKETIDSVLDRMRMIYATDWAVQTRLYPGIAELLDRLSGHRLGILSNKPDDFTQKIVAHFFSGTFDIVRGARDDTPLKPAPDAGHEIASEWSVPIETIVYVGDSAPDVNFARNAGMPCIGVSWGFRGREELEREGADLIIDQAEEFETALQQL